MKDYVQRFALLAVLVAPPCGFMLLGCGSQENEAVNVFPSRSDSMRGGSSLNSKSNIPMPRSTRPGGGNDGASSSPQAKATTRQQ